MALKKLEIRNPCIFSILFFYFNFLTFSEYAATLLYLDADLIFTYILEGFTASSKIEFVFCCGT